MLPRIPARNSQLLLRCSHRAPFVHAGRSDVGAGGQGSSSRSLKNDATIATADSASRDDATSKRGEPIGTTAQGLVKQPQLTSVGRGSTQGRQASRFGSSFPSLLCGLSRPNGCLVPALLALPQACLKHTLTSSNAEQPAESHGAEGDAASASSSQASAATEDPRRRKMPYIDGLPQAWSSKSSSDKSSSSSDRRVLPDDGTIAAALRVYQRELQKRRFMMAKGAYSAEDLALAEAAIQKSRRILNSRQADPLHAQEHAERTAKMLASARERRKRAPVCRSPTFSTDEKALPDRRLYPLWKSASPDDESIAAALADQARARKRLRRAKAEQLGADILAPLEQAVQRAEEVCAERSRDPRNAEERRAMLVRKTQDGLRFYSERREEILRNIREAKARVRASKGLKPFVRVGLGFVEAWTELAASQGKTLAPLGTDDGSVSTAYRMRLRVTNEIQHLRKTSAHPDEVLKAQGEKDKWTAAYQARLLDPANAKEREVYQAVIRKQEQWQTSKGFSEPERILERLRTYANTAPNPTPNGSIAEALRLRKNAAVKHLKARRLGAEPALLALLEERSRVLCELYRQRWRDPRNAEEADAMRAQRDARPSSVQQRVKPKPTAAVKAAGEAPLQERESSEEV